MQVFLGILKVNIASDKRGIHILFFLFLLESICFGTLMSTHNIFLWRNKKNISTLVEKSTFAWVICSPGPYGAGE